MPDVDQGTVAVTVEVRPGLKIEEVDKILSKVEAIVKAEPDRKSTWYIRRQRIVPGWKQRFSDRIFEG